MTKGPHHKVEHHNGAPLTKKEIEMIDKVVVETESHQKHYQHELHREFEEANAADIRHEQEKELYEQ